MIFTESLIDAPENVTLIQFPARPYEYPPGSGRTRIYPPTLKASWDEVFGAAGYKVQFFKGKELLTTIELNNQTFYYEYYGLSVTEGENYHVRVYSVSV